MHLWFGEGTLTLVGVPLVWWVYLWFGGVPLVTFSLVGVPPVRLGWPWFGVGTLGYCQFGLGFLGFVGIPLICWGTLGLVELPLFGGVLLATLVWLG